LTASATLLCSATTAVGCGIVDVGRANQIVAAAADVTDLGERAS
jgi:hypothetical protein